MTLNTTIRISKNPQYMYIMYNIPKKYSEQDLNESPLFTPWQNKKLKSNKQINSIVKLINEEINEQINQLMKRYINMNEYMNKYI